MYRLRGLRLGRFTGSLALFNILDVYFLSLKSCRLARLRKTQREKTTTLVANVLNTDYVPGTMQSA